jgi:hypothetical protein
MLQVGPDCSRCGYYGSAATTLECCDNDKVDDKVRDQDASVVIVDKNNSNICVIFINDGNKNKVVNNNNNNTETNNRHNGNNGNWQYFVRRRQP